MELKYAILNTESHAPTVNALSLVPGDPIVPYLPPNPSLPAAITDSTPAFVALSTAISKGLSGTGEPPKLILIISTASSVSGLPSGSRQ